MAHRKKATLLGAMLSVLLSTLFTVSASPANAVEPPPDIPDAGNLGSALYTWTDSWAYDYEASNEYYDYRQRGSLRNAQTFTAERTGQIPRVQLKLARYANPDDAWFNYYNYPGDLQVHVTTVNASGKPTDDVLATATVAPADVEPFDWNYYWNNNYQFRWQTVTASFASQALVQAGHKYAIVLEPEAPPAASSQQYYNSGWYWGVANPYEANPYTGGSLHYRYGYEYSYTGYYNWSGSYDSGWQENCAEGYYDYSTNNWVCTSTYDGIFGVFVAISDATAPELDLPADRTVEATGPDGAAVNFTASADDAVDGSVPVTCSKVSGDTFALGTTTVNCSATDAANNTAEGSFTVTVQDTTAPQVSTPSLVSVQATSADGAVANYEATASDLVSGTVPVDCSPASGNTFAPGDTTVTCTATDAAANQGSQQFTVRVRYGFNGFFAPVNGGSTINVTRAGRAIPIKFNLSGNMGLNVFKTGWPKSVASTGCTGTEDAIESTETAGNSSLTYDATANQYNYVWKTDTAWAGSCRKLSVAFNDGTERTLLFQFTK